ncbi:SDR family oxidoreductase [Nocardia sp. alder85J]|uniref:SDR family oxidoreductase n=1 Tax=Nocardia sp. alder85J TaxID=2862949 RepID=UPI001CD59A25|nr:NAD(P)-binding oxidoreductase [Nocardia sp. alder85J]MCX4099278.1 SDR family oxidoreductase [Nocardia sp. alder85J]
MSILVVGGSGRTGRRVAELLTASGHEVIVGGRHPHGPHALTVDLAHEPAPELLRGVDGVIVSVEPPTDAAGATAVMHHGIAGLAKIAATQQIPVVLISQIYITRAAAHPELADIIRARGAGEQALRDSGTPYSIVRPSWLTDGPATGARLEQGDRGDGRVSRDTVARAAVAALLSPEAHGKTFELYDGPVPPDWTTAFTELAADT